MYLHYTLTKYVQIFFFNIIWPINFPKNNLNKLIWFSNERNKNKKRKINKNGECIQIKENF
jgi:hypothetical protein